MSQRKTAFRTLLSTIVASIFVLAMTTFGVSALTVPTTVTGTGTAKIYSDFQEITSAADLTDGHTYFFSPIKLTGNTGITALPNGSSQLTMTSTTNGSDTNASGDGSYTIQKYADVLQSGTGFDSCTSGGIWYGVISTPFSYGSGKTSGSDPYPAWYYWCNGGGVHGVGPFYCYSYTETTYSAADAVVSLNDNFNGDTTTITSSMLNVKINGNTISSYTLTDPSVNQGTDNTFTFTDNGITYTCTIPTYTVTFNALTGGTCLTSSITAWQGFGVKLPAVTTANTFTGWYTLGNAKAGDTADLYTPTNDVTLYAHYANYYNAFFVDSDGTLYGYATGLSGANIVNPVALTPTKTGYTFSGAWNTAVNGSGTNYTAGTSAFGSGNVVYYAQWTPKTYYYKYDGVTNTYTISDTNNGGTAAAYGSTVNLQVPAKTNYLFDGWVNSGDGTIYSTSSGATVPYTVDGPATLTAKFEKDPAAYHTVRFIDAGTGAVYSSYYKFAEDTSVTAPAAPTKTGYTFNGWVNAANSGDTLTAGSSTVSFSGDKDYKATWTALKFSVTQSLDTYNYTITQDNGGSANFGDAVSLNVPTKAGYTFVGWEDTTDNQTYGNVGDVGTVSYTINRTATTSLTAKFIKNVDDYKLVKFINKEDGVIYNFFYQNYGTDSTITAPAAPSRAGSTFNYWVNAANGSDTVAAGGTVTLTAATPSTVVYYADWTALSYYYWMTGTGSSAEYHVSLNDGSNGMAPVANYGTTVGLTAPAKTGYTFVGWIDQANDLTYSNILGGLVQYTIFGETTLDPVFIEDVDYFKLVRFIDKDTNETYGYYYRHVDENTVVAPAAPTKAGYSFVQWTNTESSIDTLDPGDTVNFGLNTAAGQKDYYAQWLGDVQQLAYSGAFGTSTHVNSAFDSASPGSATFRTGDVITFDCTGSATASTDDNVVPESHYTIAALHFTYKDGDGVTQNVTVNPGANGICTFTMPVTSDGKVTYYAEAQQTTFTITDLTGAHLSATAYVNGSATTLADAGSTVRVAFTADTGYTLDEDTIRINDGTNDLTYQKVTDGTTVYYQFTMPAADVKITADAHYSAHTVSVNTSNCSVTELKNATAATNIVTGSTLVPAGNIVSFKATALAGYAIADVTVVRVDNMSPVPVTYDTVAGEYSFTMPDAAVKITISAEKDKASLVILDNDNTLLGIESVEQGSSVTVSGKTITVGSNTYTASAIDGYTFKEWQKTADSTQFNSHTAINGYFIVKPVYEANYYGIKLASDSSGDATVKVTYSTGTGVTLTPTGTTTTTGDNVQVTATPDPNYQITGIAVRAADGSTKVVETRLVSKDPVTGAWTYNFVMPAYAVEVAAYTEAIPYHLTVNELGFPEGGAYTIDGAVTDNAYIKQGTNTKIAITPQAGYYIKHIKAYYQVGSTITYLTDVVNNTIYDNSANGDFMAESPYTVTLNMPAHDVILDITYAKVNYTFTTTCVETSWGTISGLPASANVGDLINFTVVANYGYNLKTLTVKYGAINITPVVTGTPSVGGDGKTTYYYQFTMPASNVGLTATFVKNQYTVTFVDYDGKTLETQTLNYLDKPSVPNIIPTRTGYHFTGWTKNTTLENPGYGNSFVSSVYETTQATVIYATYEINNYDIDYVFDSAKGTVTGPANADYNAAVTANVTPKTGYKIDTVTATYLDANNVKQGIVFTSIPSDKEAGGNYVFTMPAVKAGTKVTFTATFTEITRTVYLGKVDHAAVTINGIDAEDYHVNANYNSTVTIKVTPDAGYKLTGLTVTKRGDATTVVKDFASTLAAAGGSYNFTMPAYDVDVNVTIIPIEYNVTWNNDAHSTITNVPGGYDYKEAVSFSVTPEAGYQIKSVKASYLDENGLKRNITFDSDEPTDLTAKCDYAFTMPLNDVSIVVVTEPIIYKVSVNVNGSGAYRLNSNDTDVKWTTAAYKSTVKITPEPALGWELSTITSSNGDAITANGDGTYTLSMDKHEDVTVNITYIQTTYNIGYNTPANGTISLNDLTKQYQHDANFTVTPADGYQIKSVIGTYTDENGKQQTITFKAKPSDIVAGGVYTFVMPAANVSVVVAFEEITYKVVTGSVIGEGSIKLNTYDTANITAKYGETVKITATPKAGWYLKTLTVTNDKTQTEVAYSPALAAAGGDYTFTMPSSDVTVSAEFAKITYNIGTDITYAGYGTITVAPTASEGDKVDFTVTPNYGYKIKADSVYVKDKDGHAVAMASGAYSFTMPAKDVTVYVTFVKIKYEVTFVDYNNHQLGDTQFVDYLDPAAAPTAPTREGYTFTGWDQDFSSVTQKMTVKAQYKINTPTVTVASTANGDTTVDKLTPDYNSTVTVTADPADGYRFKSISVLTAGGKAVTTSFVKEDLDYVTTYKFTMPDDNVTVTVEYSEQASSDYTDVRSDDWFYHAVTFVSDRAYFQGVGDNLFAPYDKMTRAMFVTVLGRLSQVDTSLYTVSAFEDVPVNSWYGPYVVWANQNNIVLGYGDNDGNGKPEFGPDDNITREQMAAIMYRYAIACGYDTSEKNLDWMSAFVDSDQSHAYASDAIAWCVGNGIIHGYDLTPTETLIDPLGYATRAQVAQVIQNFVDKLIYK